MSGRATEHVLRIVLVLWAGAVLCSADAAANEASEPVNSSEVVSVAIHGDGPERTIVLEGLGELPFATPESGSPKRLDLELVGAVLAGKARRIAVNDGLVEAIELSTFRNDPSESGVRVEITLTEKAGYSVAFVPEGLAIQLSADSAVAQNLDLQAEEDSSITSNSLSNDPWTRNAIALDESAPKAIPRATETVERARVKTRPASRVLGLSITEPPGGVLLHVDADGKIGATRIHTRDDPARLVVDLPGLESDLKDRTIDVKSPEIRRVRVRHRSGDVRLEIEARNPEADFSGRRVVPAADGLWIALGGSPELSASLERATGSGSSSPLAVAVPAAGPVAPEDKSASEPQAEKKETLAKAAPARPSVVGPRPESASTDSIVRILAVQFESQPQRDRVIVRANGPISYDVLTPNPETLVVSLPESVISPEAEGRIEPHPGSSIALVTAFSQPEVANPEVRIVIRRQPDLVPQISAEGGFLFIDFPKTDASSRPRIVSRDASRSSLRVPNPAGLASAVASDPKRSEVSKQEGGAKDESLLAGLQQTEPRDVQRAQNQMDREWRQTGSDPIKSGSSSGPVPAAPAQPDDRLPVDLLEEGGLLGGKVYAGRRISLDFKDVPISDVLRLVAEVSDLNVVAGDEVQGKVTIRMMEVPWDQALDVILMTKGLGFIRVGNVLRIAPNEVLQAEAEVRLQERRNREKLEDLIVKIHPVNYANVNEAASLVERLLTERGTVNKDERTSTLIIKDIPSVVEEAVMLVNAIDTQTPQVLIEAKIVEANLDFLRELGSQWSVGSQKYQNGFTQTGNNETLGSNDFRLHDINSVAFANPISGVPTAAAALNAFLLDGQINLDVQLQAREATGETKVVSSPRIVTMDNRKAEIEQGVSIPFQTFEQGDAKLEFVDAVLSLSVTPHITSDDSIIMELELTRNAPSEVPNMTGSPSIAKNVAKTETLVRDGQTLVLGGIYTLTKVENHTAVPYLSRIPILGSAFQSKTVRDDRKELLMFVTPRIMRDPFSG